MKNNFLLVLAIAGLFLWNLKQCQDNKELKINLDTFDSNLDALRDTVRIEKNKAGEIEFSRQALISKSNDLEKWNKELAEELKKEKGKVIFLQKAVAGINNTPRNPPSINNEVIVHKYDKSQYTILTKSDTTYSLDNFRKLSIETKVKLDSSKVKWSTSKITSDIISFNIVTGLKEEDGKLRIMLRSDYPGLTFSKIEGALIDPHKSDVLKKAFPPKKFGAGPMIGYGLTQNMKPVFFVGVGIQYNIIRW